MSTPRFPYHPDVVESEVGQERTGKVFADLRPDFDMFMVADDCSFSAIAVAKKFTDPAVFDKLHIGIKVRFRTTLYFSRVVEISIIDDAQR